MQIGIVPISEKHLEYAKNVKVKLEAAGLRVELDERNEKMNAKIRDLTLLSDIFPTGYHGAVSAGVGPGSIVYIAGAGPVVRRPSAGDRDTPGRHGAGQWPGASSTGGVRGAVLRPGLAAATDLLYCAPGRDGKGQR